MNCVKFTITLPSCGYLQLGAAEEGGTLQEGVGSGMTVSGGVVTLAAGVMAGVSSETRVSSQADRRDATPNLAIGELIRMEVEVEVEELFIKLGLMKVGCNLSVCMTFCQQITF